MHRNICVFNSVPLGELVYHDLRPSVYSQIARFMGPTWVLSAPDGPHVGPTDLAIRIVYLFIIFTGGHLNRGSCPCRGGLIVRRFWTDHIGTNAWNWYWSLWPVKGGCNLTQCRGVMTSGDDAGMFLGPYSLQEWSNMNEWIRERKNE